MTTDKLRDVKEKGQKMAITYCRIVLSSAPQAPIMVADLERAFQAGYEAGTLHCITTEEFMDAMDKLADKVVDEVSDA